MAEISCNLKNAMQGILYWMGYRKSLYRGYEIREIPIADQFGCILQSNLNDGSIVKGEVSYEKLLYDKAKEYDYLKNKFADIVVFDSGENLDSVIEVKRYGAPWKEIYEDVKRLSVLKRDRSKNVYELIVADRVVPEEFVDKSTGRAVCGDVFISPWKADKNPLENDCVKCSVVRVCSLTPKKLSVNKLENDSIQAGVDIFENAYFACLLEIAPAKE